MKPGSVIVDLAGETGGNCELTEPGEVVVKHDVTIVSPLNLAATMPEHASAALRAQRAGAARAAAPTTSPGPLKLDFEDEIVAGACRRQETESVQSRLMLVTNLAILVLAGFVGYAVISKVPNTLHTPLMSGTNAIHGIVVLGGILLLSRASPTASLNKLLLVIAVIFGTINVVGGFLVTDRMLEMFKSKPKERRGRRSKDVITRLLHHGPELHGVLYIVSFGCSSTA